MTWDHKTYRLTDAGGFGRWVLIVGMAGLVLCVVAYVVDAPRFFHAYLTAFVFWLSVPLGALFFTMLHHMVGAKWSVVVRRLSENLMTAFPALAILFIPLIPGMHSLYEWTHAETVAADPILAGKTPYLNMPFFIVRAVIYFAIWWFLASRLYRVSLQQDDGHSQALTDRMKRISAPGIILLALTLSGAAFDWLMSLDPHWYSTIFAVNYFGSSFVASIAVIILTVIWLQQSGVLRESITVEHYHDLGKLMFAFIIFWGYTAFSQYMLIWYGNIPEETEWYLARWQGSWKTITMIIVYGHFVVPFLGMLFRSVKRNRLPLGFFAVWMLAAHWLNMYWLVYPTLFKDGPRFSWMDLAAFLGIGGVTAWYVWRQFVSRPLVPVNDPKLSASLTHVNTF
jgi:hypothetical protein